MKIAVIGGGISGLASAYLLSKKYEVDIYEKENRFGGHARTTQVEENGKVFGVDTGFLVFNHQTYPLLTKLFKILDVKIEYSNMSFGFWDKQNNIAYNGESLSGLFFQKKNLFSFSHYKMIKDIIRFNKKANSDLEIKSVSLQLSLEEYLKDFSQVFKDRYLLPMGASIWSTPGKEMNKFPAYTFLTFFRNHGLLGVNTHHKWLTVSNGSVNYVHKILNEISGKVITNSDVLKVKRVENKIHLIHANNSITIYDKVILAMHAPEALEILDDPTQNEIEILSAFKYKSNRAILHNDKKLLYPDKRIYAAWNYKNDSKNSLEVSLSYWINKLQNLKAKKDYFVSLNEIGKVDKIIEEIEYSHPQFDLSAIKMQSKREVINGKSNTYFAGAYWRYGFHEDGLWSANTIAKNLGCEL